MDTRSMKTVNANPTRKPLTKTWHLLIVLAHFIFPYPKNSFQNKFSTVNGLINKDENVH